MDAFTIELVRTLADYLREAHQAEIDANHYGDGPGCSYCTALAAASAWLSENDD